MASLHTLTKRFLIENKTLPSLREDLKEEVEAWVGISTNINVSGHPKLGARKDADRPKRRNSWPRPWAKKLPRTRIGSLTKTSRGPDVSFGRPGFGSPHRENALPLRFPRRTSQVLRNASQPQSPQQVRRRLAGARKAVRGSPLW